MVRDEADWTSSGRLFQSCGPAVDKNSSVDEIANVNVFTTTSYM